MEHDSFMNPGANKSTSWKPGFLSDFHDLLPTRDASTENRFLITQRASFLDQLSVADATRRDPSQVNDTFVRFVNKRLLFL
jgi:hypothetical protein